MKIKACQVRGSSDPASSYACRRVRALTDQAGNTQVHEADIVTSVKNFYDDCYGDPSSYAELPSWIWGRFAPSALSGLPRLDGYLIRTTLQRLPTGKTCSKYDIVVAEMIFSMPEELADMLAEIFRLRILNHRSEDEETLFDLHEATLIAKFFGAISVKDFRPIAVLSAFLKLYFLVLGELFHISDIHISQFQFAFRKGYQGHEIITIIRLLAEKSIELSEPLFVFDGDIHKAYDFTSRWLHDLFAAPHCLAPCATGTH